jgi:hypothetical protein
VNVNAARQRFNYATVQSEGVGLGFGGFNFHGSEFRSALAQAEIDVRRARPPKRCAGRAESDRRPGLHSIDIGAVAHFCVSTFGQTDWRAEFKSQLAHDGLAVSLAPFFVSMIGAPARPRRRLQMEQVGETRNQARTAALSARHVLESAPCRQVLETKTCFPLLIPRDNLSLSWGST